MGRNGQCADRRARVPAPGLRELADLVGAAMAALGLDPYASLVPAAGRLNTVLAGALPADPSRPDFVKRPAQPMLTLAADTGTVTAGLPAGTSTVAAVPEDGTADGTEDQPGLVAQPSAEHAEVWELVRRAQAGDGEAFGQLYDRYVDMVFRFVYFRVNDRALAEDFTSETFLRALRRISSISYQGRDIGAWFVTIARNIIFDHSKSARNRLEVTTPELLDGDEHAPSPETATLDSFTATALVAAIKQLNPEQRECVTLRFIQGFSVSETAAAMGKNDGAIKALQHRAVKKLAEIVGDSLR
jgi:RNA polymerase sigma-70 factor (ECF subfamily)